MYYKSPEQVKEEYGSINSMCLEICNCYTAVPDDYCTGGCLTLDKMKTTGFGQLANIYAKHDGNLLKVLRYIKTTKKGIKSQHITLEKLYNHIENNKKEAN